MHLRRSALPALLLLATSCDRDPGKNLRVDSTRAALGSVPASERATWTHLGSTAAADSRYLQTAAFDESRKVLVMFGGLDWAKFASNATAELRELWDWDPATGIWTNRTPADNPSARQGSVMVFDSARSKFVIFGGRADVRDADAGTSTHFVDYSEIWEWDATAGTMSNRTGANRPAGRSQHGMVYEKSSGKVLLFGGGSSDNSLAEHEDATILAVALGDTWEWDPAAGKWSELQPKNAPSARYAFGLVWDSKRNVAVLFGGMEKPQAGLNGIPKQDIWEWDPSTQAWTNRTTTGSKPSPRYGHAMTYDPGRGVTVLAGGWDIANGGGLADVWEWDPSTGAWTERLTGSEPNLPAPRRFASLVADSARSRLDLVGGLTTSPVVAPDGEIWELEPVAATFTDRTPPPAKAWPTPRELHSMAFCPTTGKTYVFGGSDSNNAYLDDLWEWDGSAWTEVEADLRPSARMNAALAYDPFRKSLILYGGVNDGSAPGVATVILGDTWEWNPGTRKWSQLHPASSPEPRVGAGMVSDSGRAKLLLFGGERPSFDYTYPTPGTARTVDPLSNAVWEWDGATATWSNRTPIPLAVAPAGRDFPLLTFDNARQKMVLLDGQSATATISIFWEWDPVSAGWAARDSGDVGFLDNTAANRPVVYDSLRRRQIVPIAAPNVWQSPSDIETWELDSQGPTWYLRMLSAGPNNLITRSTVAFDSQRGVVVLFGGDNYAILNDTWEYKVTNLGNGEGCTSATASSCASGFCVDGVCCGVAACAGSCQSCAGNGHAGTCASVAAGTEVPGSCAGGQACDGNGVCKSNNGTACSTATLCASGFCVDGVCCESACADTCASCNQAGRAGKCSAYSAGSDPEHECGTGSDPCRLTCNGAGACDGPQFGTPCGPCAYCDGAGKCFSPDPSACGAGAAGGSGGGGSGGTGTSSEAGGVVSGGAAGVGGTSGAGGGGGVAGASGSLDASSDTIAPDASSADGDRGAIALDASEPGRGRDATAPDAGSADGGRDLIVPDAGSADGSREAPDASSADGGRDAIPADASAKTVVGRSGCDCDLGQTSSGTPERFFSLFGVAFLWARKLRRIFLRALATLLLLATCCESSPGNRPRLESSLHALGTVPATESATWTQVATPSAPVPKPRYLQSAAFDDTRKLLVMFGGWSGGTVGDASLSASQDLWEWDPSTGKWTERIPSGSQPSPRAGASMVFDSTRNKFVIFGGRATTGYDYEDTWEWDPASGVFTDRTSSVGPGGRSQHSMVFEKSTGKVLLFGGGLADSASSIWPEDYSYSDPAGVPGGSISADGSGISLAFGDTWEWDAGAWTQLKPTSAPGARYDSGLIWDSKRNRAVLFGGMQKPQADADGVPQNDVWDWDPAQSNWTLRASKGQSPSARWGHALAYDPGRGMAVLTGGRDFQTYLGLADLWDWDPKSGAWTERLTGSEGSLPAGRMYASLVANPAQSRLDLLAGITFYLYQDNSSPNPSSQEYQTISSAELWELDPAAATFSNRSAAENAPSSRWGNAIAFCPATGKTYVFGGKRANCANGCALFDDLWEWDGTAWSQVEADVRPPARSNTVMAYDPYRKSLIVYGGVGDPSSGTLDLQDTWEWQSGTRQWTQLDPESSPDCLDMDSPGMAMVTDSAREKLLLFGFDGCANRSAVWQWDGATKTWSNRTPVPGSVSPGANGTVSENPLLTFDDGRQKMFLLWGQTSWQGTTSNSVFWEWDPVSAGWALRDSGDFVNFGFGAVPVVAYDSLRRRQVVPAQVKDASGNPIAMKTWELDTRGPTWYARDPVPGPTAVTSATMAFDSQRGVMVLFAAGPDDGAKLSQTWEYKVTNFGNGEGCTAATASICASGFCVDGVCCASAACSGTCQSCNVAGHEGTCTPVTGGTEVSGSCPGQACDSSGSCKAKNGSACSSASACAAGFCVDGMCCESVCDGSCVSCNQANHAGKCLAFAAGSDPEKECGLGSGVCRSTCNGAGACDYPQVGTPCATCKTCDGSGMCLAVDPSACDSGGAGGLGGTSAGGASGQVGAVGSGGTNAGGRGSLGGASGGASGFGGSSAVGGLTGTDTGGAGGAVAAGGASGGAGEGGGTSGVGGSVVGAIGGAGGSGGMGSGSASRSGGSISGDADGGGGAAGWNRSDGGQDLIASDAVRAGSGGISIAADAASSDSGEASIAPDAGSSAGAGDSRPPDVGQARLGHKGCDCNLGRSARRPPALPLVLLGAAILWRRRRPL
jgi:N-acetylneuraminic acid mutarotase